ncbi:MAG: c-type cytochrome [Myxococcales bacterium]
MKKWLWVAAVPTAMVIYAAASSASTSTVVAAGNNGAADGGNGDGNAPPDAVKDFAAKMIDEGRDTFRNDTFGDEAFWDAIQLNKGVETVSPKAALGVGLKVDLDALDAATVDALENGKVNLDDPAVTATLLKGNAVVGLKAQVDAQNHVKSLGITCALCHSTVDNAVAPGVGHRLDGWPNRDLNVGAIVALSRALTPGQRAVYSGWGPGKYDPRFNQDGKNTPLVLPPAYGLARVSNETYTADGPISYWNAYVAVTQMHGHGNFSDPRLGIRIVQTPDQVTSKLAALRMYQHSLPTPAPPAGSFDAAAAARGRVVFNRTCAGCHVGGSGTDNNRGVLHAPAETGMDGAYAARTVNKRYRTTPLRGLWQHPPYFHDGSARTLADVVAHYNRVRSLHLTAAEQSALVEYLKSL